MTQDRLDKEKCLANLKHEYDLQMKQLNLLRRLDPERIIQLKEELLKHK